MFTSFKIGHLEIKPNLVLAPMSGVTCSSFRRLIKQLNPGAVGLLVTEFISVEGLTRESTRSVRMMHFHPEEHPLGIQIFGHDINRMRDAALMAQDAGADLVDINCGCPAPKVVKKGGGCELMRQPQHLRMILREVRKFITVPLTIKMRSGWDSENRNAVEIAKIAEGEGVNSITVHGRTRFDLYRGEADWEFVHQVRDTVKIPVCGSGDVVDRKSAEARVQKSGANGLYVGRAAISNPFVFTDIVNGSEKIELTKLQVIEKYVELLSEEFEPQYRIGRLKQLVSQMCKGESWSKPFCRSQSYSEAIDVLHRAREANT